MKIRIVIVLFTFFILISGCQTIKKKSDEVAAKENERFGLFVGQQVNELNNAETLSSHVLELQKLERAILQ